MENPKNILDLQAKDSEIQTSQKRLREIEAQLSDNSLVTNASKIDEAIQLQFQNISTQIRRLEGDNNSLQTQQKSITTKIYGGSITSQKELTALQDELTNLEGRIEGLEDSLLSAMVDYDKYEEGVKKSSENLSAVQEKRESLVQRISTEKQKLELDLASLEVTRSELQAKIPSTLYATYERLRKSKDGLAVSVMQGERCSACNISVPMQIAQTVASTDEIRFCNSCQRILMTAD
ncbi:MAG: C4-type zinc ribbon domain-containing protein [SAR202 cluster bacterium]|nr:C4-type zinc ribbon domain-containing protein [SAR202 cluster bacterium]